MHASLLKIDQFSLLQGLPDLKVGQTVRIEQKFKDGEKERFQTFEGIIIKREHGNTINGTMTIRKVVDGVGVERIIPIHSPLISKIDIIKQAKVRRSKLHFLRYLGEKASRMKNIAIEKSYEPKKVK